MTFVNPLPEKGVYPFVRIAQELGRRRPDIPLLVVESRGTREMLAAWGWDAEPPDGIHHAIMAERPIRGSSGA